MCVEMYVGTKYVSRCVDIYALVCTHVYTCVFVSQYTCLQTLTMLSMRVFLLLLCLYLCLDIVRADAGKASLTI